MTDAREITVEEIVPCMDAWCKISPCKCRDSINALIAERDKLKEEKEEFEVWSEQQRAKLVKRVSVLEGCLRFFASVIKSGEAWTATCEAQYRAALRTSEDV
jgi:hypothetical protein